MTSPSPDNGGSQPPMLETYPTTLVERPISLPTSGSERSLLNGAYSTFDDTSVGSASSPSSPQIPHQQSSASVLKVPNLPTPTLDFATSNSKQLSFRPSHQHATWARTFHSRPELWILPQTTEEVQKTVLLARRCRRRLITVGSGHSPSDLTCSSSWMLNLDGLTRVIKVQKYSRTQEKDADLSKGYIFPTSSSSKGRIYPQRYAGRALVQAGISLEKLNNEMKAHGLTLPNLGSINVQSLAGAVATATHGSSLNHGILSSNIRGLRIVLPSGEARWCSAAEDEYPDLFRAALVSLGALGVITEIEIELAAACNIEWETTTMPLAEALQTWNTGLWTRDEFVRCWWMPYTRRLVVWSGSKTDKPCRKPDRGSSYGGWLGYHMYQSLLWIANKFPRLVPWVERLVMGMEHGSSNGHSNGGVDEQRTGLLMDCLYSQFVNEWAIPLEKGPEAIRRFEEWLLGANPQSDIPVSNKGLYAHAPIEVRVSNGTVDETEIGQPRAFLDQSCRDGPTLYLNATLYRPYGSAPPWKDRYYEAFEWLMKEMGGRPHWAKNFGAVSVADFEHMYGEDLKKWMDVRRDVDPDGMFVGEWHRRNLLGPDGPRLALEETQVSVKERWMGGMEWSGAQAVERDTAAKAEEQKLLDNLT